MALFTVAVFVGLAITARHSWLATAGYVAINIVAALGIAYTYCGKCACRTRHCSHFVIGKMADWLPQRPPGPYTRGDYAGMLLSAVAVFVYPLPWLWAAPVWLAAYTGIFLIATLDILLAVCPRCKNTRCPAARWPARKRE
jgi:hypothetical protein